MLDIKTRQAEEEYKSSPETWKCEDMYKWWNNDKRTFEELTDDQKVCLIHTVGFIIWAEKDGLAVQDMQEANLGDIENERFNNVSEICERIEHYFLDYFEEC